jgi:anaerobic magnesium-protoporphyrin IX monomethyl ester cyclase
MTVDALLLRPKGAKTDSRVFGMEQLGLSYLAAAARAAGHTARIVDGFLDPQEYETVLNGLPPSESGLIGFPVYAETVRRVASDVRKLRERGIQAHVTIGNHLATLHDKELLRDFPQFDSAIRGEGELTLVDLLTTLKSGGSFENVHGLTYRHGSEIIRNPPRSNIENLDELPYPARDSLPLVLNGGNAPLLYSSRGCNARCDFCSVHNFFRASPGGVWRGRSAENVVDEIVYLASEFGVSEFVFADEQFLGHGSAGATRAMRIADEILRRNISIRWYIETRATSVRRDVFSKLKEAGLAAVFMGLESGYDLALKQMRKGLRAEQSLAAVEVLKSLEIIPVAGFIMFRPDSTPEEIRGNLDFIERAGCVDLTALATALRVYSGTESETTLKKRGMLHGPYYDYTWDFGDRLVGRCYGIVLSSADILSVTYNAFARFRRLGLLSYSETLKLQHLMNGPPIESLRQLLTGLASAAASTEHLNFEYRKQLTEASENFLRILRLLEAATDGRIRQGVKLLNPMSLC